MKNIIQIVILIIMILLVHLLLIWSFFKIKDKYNLFSQDDCKIELINGYNYYCHYENYIIDEKDSNQKLYKVKKIAVDKTYIMVLQNKYDRDYYWILNTKKDKMYGPYRDIKEYEMKKQELGILNSKLIDVDNFKEIQYIVSKQKDAFDINLLIILLFAFIILFFLLAKAFLLLVILIVIKIIKKLDEVV